MPPICSELEASPRTNAKQTYTSKGDKQPSRQATENIAALKTAQHADGGDVLAQEPGPAQARNRLDPGMAR